MTLKVSYVLPPPGLTPSLLTTRRTPVTLLLVFRKLPPNNLPTAALIYLHVLPTRQTLERCIGTTLVGHPILLPCALSEVTTPLVLVIGLFPPIANEYLKVILLVFATYKREAQHVFLLLNTLPSHVYLTWFTSIGTVEEPLCNLRPMELPLHAVPFPKVET